ncbi:MAG TPA: hypothetical protein VI636_03145 [Candidatus Angelobacter sp.]
MADPKVTSTRQDFPEARDKIVELVELDVEADYYAITMRFQDKTSLTFSIEPCVFTFPRYSRSEDGEEKIVKEYEPIRSTVEGLDI